MTLSYKWTWKNLKDVKFIELSIIVFILRRGLSDRIILHLIWEGRYKDYTTFHNKTQTVISFVGLKTKEACCYDT